MSNLKSTLGSLVERTGASPMRLRAPLDLQGLEDELMRVLARWGMRLWASP